MPEVRAGLNPGAAGMHHHHHHHEHAHLYSRNMEKVRAEKKIDKWSRTKKRLYRRNAFWIILARTLYLLHEVLTIYRVAVAFGHYFWSLLLGSMFIVIEAAYVLIRNDAKEWVWFQPVVMLYFIIEIPCLWLLQLQLISSVQVEKNDTAMLGVLFKKESAKNTLVTDLAKLGDGLWLRILVQTMLVIVIINRWSMPKRNVTQKQLSVILLLFMGIAADAVEFFSILTQSKELLLNRAFVLIIISTWSWSVLPFMFVTTFNIFRVKRLSTGYSSIHNVFQSNPNVTRTHVSRNYCLILRNFVQSDMWSIFISVVMVDGPYFIVRVACLYYWQIWTYTNFFFAAKNLFILALQCYKIRGIYINKRLEKKAAEITAELQGY